MKYKSQIVKGTNIFLDLFVCLRTLSTKSVEGKSLCAEVLAKQKVVSFWPSSHFPITDLPAIYVLFDFISSILVFLIVL